MAYTPKTFITDSAPPVNDTHLNGVETQLSNKAKNARYAAQLGTGVGVGSSVFPTSNVWNEVRDGIGVVDGESNIVFQGGIAEGLNNLVQDDTYYSHSETGLDSASYDNKSFTQPGMLWVGMLYHNAKLYNYSLFPPYDSVIRQYSYTKGDITATTYDTKTYDAGAEMTLVNYMFPLGNKMYIANTGYDIDHGKIFQYSWTPGDITTLSYDGKYFDFNDNRTIDAVFSFQIIGNRMIVFAYNEGTDDEFQLYQYYMPDLDDITTIEYEYTFIFDVAQTGFGKINKMCQISGGKLYVIVDTLPTPPRIAENIIQYNFPDPLDIRKITYDNKVLNTGSEEDDLRFFAIDDEFIYALGIAPPSWPIIFQYSISALEAIGNLSDTVSPREAGIALSATELLVTLKQSEVQATKDITTETYTLILDDKDYLLECDFATTQTITVPLNASVAYKEGTRIAFAQNGARTLTLAPAGGVTLNGTLTTTAQWKTGAIVKTDTDTWLVILN